MPGTRAFGSGSDSQGDGGVPRALGRSSGEVCVFLGRWEQQVVLGYRALRGGDL